MSILFSLSSDQGDGPSNNFTVNLEQAVQLDPKRHYEVALSRCSVWRSWANISEAFGNNTLVYSHNSGSSWTAVVLPDGAYRLSDINSALHAAMLANGHADVSGAEPVFGLSIEPNVVTIRTTVVVSDPLFRLNLTSGNFRLLIGFDAQIVSATKDGENSTNISNSIDELLVCTSLVSGSVIGRSRGDVIWSMAAAGNPGSLVDVSPYERMYLPLRPANQISAVRVSFYDQTMRPVDFRGETTLVQFHVRRVQDHVMPTMLDLH